MGITGLLPKLHGITTNVHISQYSGRKAGIDASGWLYKGAYGCCMELSRGESTTMYIDYVMERVRMLKSHGIEPILVFDGGILPTKSETNQARRESRKSHKSKGMSMLGEGNEEGAMINLQRSTTVTFEMSLKVIEHLKSDNIQFLVAPYEADAQLAWLARENLIDIVISDDSDCLVYGCKRVVFKLELDGNGQEIKRRNLGANNSLNFVDWSGLMFSEMCVLAGCDYCPSLPGIGIARAYDVVAMHKTPEAILKALRERTSVPVDYSTKFIEAVMTFRHQRVYDTKKKKITFLNPIERSTQLLPFLSESVRKEDFPFLGPALPDTVARRIAHAEVHPITHDPNKTDSQVVGGRRESQFKSPNIGEAYRALIPSRHVLEREENINIHQYGEACAPSRSYRSAEKRKRTTSKPTSAPLSSGLNKSPSSLIRSRKMAHTLNTKFRQYAPISSSKGDIHFDENNSSWELLADEDADQRGVKAAEKWDKILGL